MNKDTLIFHSNLNWREEMQFYRKRRNREIRKERVKKTILMKSWSFLAIFLLICGLFYLIRETYFFLINWNRLVVKEVEIFVNNPNAKTEFNKYLKEIEGENILLIDLQELKQKLMSNKKVKKVSIKKILPSKLSIRIELRKPLAILDKRDFYFIDEEGVVFQKINNEAILNLPIIFLNDKIKKEILLEVLSHLYKIKNTPIFYKISWIKIFSNNKIYLKLKNEQSYLILNVKNFYSHLNTYPEILSKIKNNFGKLKYIDLRFKDRIYIKPLKEENNGQKG